MKKIIFLILVLSPIGLIYTQPIILDKCNYLNGTGFIGQISHIQNIGDTLLYFECPPESTPTFIGKTGNSWGLIRLNSNGKPLFIEFEYQPYNPFNNILIKDTIFLIYTKPIYYNWSINVSQNRLDIQKYLIDTNVNWLQVNDIHNVVNFKTPIGLLFKRDHIYALTYDGKIINHYNSTDDILYREYQRKYNLDTIIDDMYVSESIEYGHLPLKEEIKYSYPFYNIVIDNHGNIYKNSNSNSDTFIFKKMEYNLGEWKAGEVSGLNGNFLVYDGKKGTVIIDSSGNIRVNNSISKGFPIIDGNKIYYITYGNKKKNQTVNKVIKNKTLRKYHIKYGFVFKDAVLLLSKDGFVYTCSTQDLLNP